MRHSIARSCLCLLVIASAPFALAMEVNINFLLGSKGLDDDDWGDADRQSAFAVETTFGETSWPVYVALDLLGSVHYDEFQVLFPRGEVDVFQATTEFDFGVRKIWKSGKARPFVGGGFGIIGGSQEIPTGIGLLTVDDSDATLGMWFNGGAFWRLGKKFNIGVDFRLSGGEVTLFGQDVQAGGATLGLLLGWGWGGGGK